MIKLKAGRYVVSDPCYILTDEQYEEFLETVLDDNWKGGEVVIDNHTCVVYNTMYGDGMYHDNYGDRYAVDSGTIGIFPKEIVTLFDEYAHPVELTTEVGCWYNDGTMRFGCVEINTNDEDEVDLYYE
jgi:hypothetical protein